MSVVSSTPINCSGILLLMRAKEKFIRGNAEQALEDFENASQQLTPELIQKVYSTVWDLCNRPNVDVSTFGKDVIYSRLISDQPPDSIKAQAIDRVIREYHIETIIRVSEKLENSVICPMSAEIMKDPVIDDDGHTFERESIEDYHSYLRAKGRPISCPLSHKPVSTNLITNYSAKNLIDIQQEFNNRLSELGLFFQHLMNTHDKHELEKYLMEKEFKEKIAIYEEQEKVLFEKLEEKQETIKVLKKQEKEFERQLERSRKDNEELAQKVEKKEEELRQYAENYQNKAKELKESYEINQRLKKINLNQKEIIEQSLNYTFQLQNYDLHQRQLIEETLRICEELRQRENSYELQIQELRQTTRESMRATLQQHQQLSKNLLTISYWDVIRLLIPCHWKEAIKEVVNRKTS